MTCLVVGFEIEITTKSLSLVNLNETRTERLEWLFSLRENGYSNKEISDYLNNRGIRSPNGKVYSPKLIWITLKKYQNRLKRSKGYQITNVVERLIIR
jgi:DNA-binding transcriptional MerR regulator